MAAHRDFSGRPGFAGILLILLVILVQIGFMTSGWKGWTQSTDYYRRLSDGVLHGRLTLSTVPSPRLLKLSDPYDPAMNSQTRLHDAVLFNGKYYLYWGPAPALIAAAICLPLGIAHPTFGDQWLVFPFTVGITLMAAILIFQIHERIFPRRAFWPAAVAVLSLGWGVPVLFTLCTPAIYEAAIVGGQFFLLAGLFAGWTAVRGRQVRRWLLTVAGICWCFSVGSRLSLGPAVFAVAVITAWHLWRIRPGCGAALCALGAPLAVGVVLLAWYNVARFGSVSEFGLRYQLAARNQHHLAAGVFASPRYVIPNVLLYLFKLPHARRGFPFFFAGREAPAIRRLFHLPDFYTFETLVGLAWSQPFLIFSVFSLPAIRPGREPDEARWLVSALFAAAIVGFLPALFMGGSTMRYVMDAVPCLTILAAVGCWRWANRPSRWSQWLGWTLAVFQTIMGGLLSFTAYYPHLADSLALPGK